MVNRDDEGSSRNVMCELERLNVKYVNKCKKFILPTKDYNKQFAHIYASRLRIMGKALHNLAKAKWGTVYQIKKLSELREDNPEKCILIGTLFKHQQLKPSILREISEQNQLAPQPPRSSYVDESDKLILEDELQRIRLIGKIEIQNLVTGVVCAVLGYVESDGRFFVEEMLFYESGPQRRLPVLDETPLLVIVSGLNLASSENITVPLELFQHWLFGNIDGYGKCFEWDAASVVRVIIAGNSIRTKAEIKQKSLQTRTAESARTLDAVKCCDDLAAKWSNSVYLDLMPGEFDPSNFMLPQQPLHACMLPNAYQVNSFQCVSNPYACEIAGRTIVGTSGQNILDIMKTSNITDCLEALKSTIIWGHIAPTSPDTIACYPYVDQDPFVFEECPHVYFAGNQPEFRSGYFSGDGGKQTLLICLPTFSTTKCLVVVNLRTLECKQLRLGEETDGC